MMPRKVLFFVRQSWSASSWLLEKSVALAMILCLLLPPLSLQILAAESAQSPAGPTQAATPNQAHRVTTPNLKIPAAHEFMKSDAPGVKAHGGRISLRNLDLKKPPGETELRQAGQLGSPLTPSGPADPAKIADPTKKRLQEDDNLLFGQCMQKWNEHHYSDAVKILRQHRQKFASSPWAGEAELHLGCSSQFAGSWAEAKFSFEWILNNHQKGSDIYQKAKLRHAVLHIQQGEFPAAVTDFQEMLASETDWGRVTYARHWLQQLSLYKAHEAALRDCGADSIASIFRSRGDSQKAAEVKAALPPGPKGFSLGELTDFANKSGLVSAAAVHLGFEDLDGTPYPFVAHYKDRHFVTVLRQDETKRLWVYDPRLKRETALTREQFAEQWSGLGIVFGGVPEGGRLASTEEMQDNYGGCCGLPMSENDLGTCGSDDPSNQGGGCQNAEDSSGLGLPVWSVNPVNMNFVVRDTPMWLEEASGPNVYLNITYNSQDALNQLRPFGNKWTFAYTTYALESPAQGGPGTVLIVMPGGRRDSYQPDGAGGYTPPVGIFNTLTKTADYAFQLLLTDGTIFSYGVPAGMGGTTSLLLSITDRHGIALTMGYDGSGNLSTITDSQARQWTFSYNTGGLVSRIDDPFGRNATFSYDTNGNLVGQTDMGGLAYGYTYDANVYLTSIIKPTGTTSFYTEPADGINNMSLGYPNYSYPPYGGVMWDNYRITVTDPVGFKEEYYYFGYSHYGWHRDKVQFQATDVSSPKTRYDYYVLPSGRGVVSQITHADGTYQLSSNYTANGQPQTFLDERGKFHYHTYNSQGKILTATDPRGNVTTYQYATNGLDLIQVSDALSNVTLQLAYDAHRNITSITDALARTTTIIYNATDQPTTITDPASTIWTMNYDGSNLLTSINQGANVLRTLTYDAYDRIASSANADGYTLNYTYDGLNRPLRVSYPDGTFTENQWGCCTLEQKTDRAGRSTTFLYDALSRLEIARDPLGRFTYYQHDALGDLTNLVDGNGNPTQWQYDSRHRPIKKIFADNSSVTYGYDGLGNLTSLTDTLGVTITYAYDDADNPTSRSAPGLASTSFTYDALNRPSQMIDGIGTTVFGYDNASELTTVDGPWANDTVTLGYDALGRVNSRDINGTTASLVIDSFGRVTSATNPLGTFTYSYSAAASPLLNSVAYPNGQTTTLSYYGNAGAQRLQEIWHQNAAAQTISKFDYQYDALGEITQWTQQTDENGAQVYSLSYDAANQLTGGVVTTVADGSVQKSYGYRYDPAGNRIGEAVDTIVSQDTLNNLNQLTRRQSGSGVLPIRGQIDKSVSSVTVNGAVATVNGQAFEGAASVTTGANTVTVVATDLNSNVTTKQYQVTVGGSGSRALTYDAKGNLLNDGLKTYEWDAANELMAINYTGTSPAQRTEFTYNGLGQRVKIIDKSAGTVVSEKHFIWILGEAQPTEERDASNSVSKRFYSQGEQISGIAYYYTWDHLGSIREMIDATGTIHARYDYDPFGRRSANMVAINSREADFGFASYYWHSPSALSLTWSRAYDADMARWLSRDAIGEKGGLNLYSYVRNKPTNTIDRYGFCEEDITEEESEAEIEMLFRALAGETVPETPYPTISAVPFPRESFWDEMVDGIIGRPTRGGESEETAYGRQMHEEFDLKVRVNGGTPRPRLRGKDGTVCIPDGIMQGNELWELKPDTPSGRAAGQADKDYYEKQLGLRVKLFFYPPKQ